MFTNIGKKIKIVAIVFTIVGILGSLAGGIAVSVIMENLVFLPLITAGGAFVFWVAAFAVYGFGELIEKTTDIAQDTLEILILEQQRVAAGNTKQIKTETAPAVKPIVKSEKPAKIEVVEAVPANIICPFCGKETDNTKRFCEHCDGFLTAVPSKAEKSAIPEKPTLKDQKTEQKMAKQKEADESLKQKKTQKLIVTGKIVVCPFCGKETDATKRFCDHCDGYLGF